MQPTPPVAPKKSYATLSITYNGKHHTVRYARTTPAWLLEKTVRNVSGVAYGAPMRIVDPAVSTAEYTLDPRRLPDGKQLEVKLDGPSQRIQLSSKSSAMWFPTLSGLYSARSASSLPSMESGSVGGTAPLTDRAHYRGLSLCLSRLCQCV